MYCSAGAGTRHTQANAPRMTRSNHDLDRAGCGVKPSLSVKSKCVAHILHKYADENYAASSGSLLQPHQLVNTVLRIARPALQRHVPHLKHPSEILQRHSTVFVNVSCLYLQANTSILVSRDRN